MNLMSVINNVEGRIQPDECMKLYELAKKTNGDIVEIGSLFGKSTICLALGLKKHKVYAIDPHIEPYGTVDKSSSLEKFKENIKKAGVEKRIVPKVMTSQQAFENWKKGEIGMLWIDGLHTYEGVNYDFKHWFKLLRKDGILAFHDFILYWGGIRKTVFEASSQAKLLGLCGSIAYFLKNGKTSFLGRLKMWIHLINPFDRYEGGGGGSISYMISFLPEFIKNPFRSRRRIKGSETNGHV